MDLGNYEIAELTGYSQIQVGRWHRGKNPTLRQYIDWAEALGYEVTIKRRDGY